LGHLARTQDHRQALVLLRVGQVLFHVAPFKDPDVQEAKGTDVQNYSVDGKFPVFQKVRVVAPDIIGAELIKRSVDVFSEMFYRFQIRVDRRRGIVAAYEFFSHPLHECCHRDLLSL
jgi:hypothetical protein